MRFKETKQHYTISEIFGQIKEIKKLFDVKHCPINRGHCECIFILKPTINSISYTIKIKAKEGSTNIKVFVIEPSLKNDPNRSRIPHLYADSSLCLFYPKLKEWDYKLMWTKSIIPWASLWLFYYEIWTETGQWLGGGIHGTKNSSPNK